MLTITASYTTSLHACVCNMSMHTLTCIHIRTYIQYIVICIYTIHMQTDRQETFSLAFLYIRCNVLCHHTYTLHCTCTSLPTQSSLTKLPLVKTCQCCMSHHAHTHAQHTLYFKGPCTRSGVLEVNHIAVHVRFPHSDTN